MSPAKHSSPLKLVILDRDGVINEDSENFIKTADEWRAIPGSLEAIASLNRAGYRVVVATNQSGIARGLFTLETLNRIHDKMLAELNRCGGHIDAIFFCPHGPDDQCQCRKPLPGMLKEISEKYGVSLEGIPVVGDSLRDLQAAIAAGARPVLVETGKGKKSKDLLSDNSIDAQVYPDLVSWVEDQV